MPEDDDRLHGDRDRFAVGESGASGLWDWDIIAGLLRTDEGFADLYGIDRAAARAGVDPKLFFSRIHADDRARLKIAVAGILSGAEIFSKEFRIVRPDGTVRWMLGRGQGHQNADDEPIRFTGKLVDVTERRRAQERLRIAQTAGGVGTFEHIDGFATVAVSAQFCRVLGLHPTDVLPVTTINAAVCSGEGALIPAGYSADRVPPADFRIRRGSDGAERWIARRGEAAVDDEGIGHRFIGVIYDVTEAKEAQAQLREWNETLESRVEEAIRERSRAEDALRQAQKMEAVGQLTGGIAHDFNNLLTVIIGNVETVGRRLDSHDDPRVRRALDNAAKGAARAAALTQRLLAFSRRQPLDPKPVEVGRLLMGMSDLLTRAINESIAVHVPASGDLPHIEVDPHQLENAILNLAVNARDAMTEGGSLTIQASSDSSKREIVITVTDTGCGMSAETMEKVFDPFFTTKEVGKGTGLGLSMVHGFVMQSGGRIAIDSELGKGTTITMAFPSLSITPDVQDKDVAGFVDHNGSGETIMVVEDDEDVRAYSVGLLRELGYRVIEATDGEAALRLLERADQHIDLLLTDVVMPAMSGRELADRARLLQGELRILFISGYPREEIAKNGRIEAGIDLLGKPFGFVALSEKVRQVLDRPLSSDRTDR
ncbi:PAS domain-containing protein [Acidisoma cellulosilytica]|uniref:histidine kinase n=1 Tax=Acidisoma cellulosilyticum TaxID=2802395 RepID=A0A964E6P1_9PROT|nr:hybrid sensor histidine kinase/response regulator [Acidisoma cellulosilyticum]MCB8883667.1 PAS domain-containing protein [Acidisoma cellulosilyticum]